MLDIDRETNRWTVSDAAELYDVARWGRAYFSINQRGHVSVHPGRNPARAIDLKELVDDLRARRIEPPVLIRFGGILNDRLEEIRAAFRRAIDEYGYRADYRCIYPIKVNQQRQVIEEVLRFGGPGGCGLEVGSKSELLAVIATVGEDVPIVCNGFKDETYIELALLAQKIGRQILLVVEKYTELGLIFRYAHEHGIEPVIGIRVKLASPGAGRWHSSSGYRSKFGLSVSEVLRALDELKERGLAHRFKLLHFHLGSQITNIRHIKAALNEAARVYVDLVRLGAGLVYLDVGGGLGVDYDGSQTNFESSANYTLQEYANDVVFRIQTVCDEAGVQHPTIFSESGRAVVAYHSLLVFDVLGVADRGENGVPSELADDVEQPLRDLMDTHRELSERNMLESFHDAQQGLEMAMALFDGGHLPLDQRSQAETLFWAILRKLQRLVARLDYVPEELEGLDALLSETYYCNFSLFQSMPDSWAIKQLFPVMPIHRLDERPTHHAVLGDVTCDSDGRIDRFIGRRDVGRSLPVHALDGEPYYLAAFLVGAYQEILGDLHNLFGDTNTVHVAEGPDGRPAIEAVIDGDTVSEVLAYVQFDGAALVRQFRAAIEQALSEHRLDDDQAGRLSSLYEAALEGYTYLEDSHEE